MNKSSKYKIYIKSNKIINCFPQRIRNFRRSKWKKFVIRNRFKSRRYKFLNFFSRALPKKKKKFIKMKKYNKDCLLTKNRLSQKFDNNYKFCVLKKDLLKNSNLKYLDLLNIILIKQNYYLNILLWRLCFFSSVNESSYCINNNFVLVNGNQIKSNYFLKSGDIVTFDELFLFNLKKNFLSYRLSRNFCSFVEIDCYTSTLIIIKNYNNFILEDFTFFSSDKISISSVINSLKH